MVEYRKLLISFVMTVCLLLISGLWHGGMVMGATNITFEAEAEKLHDMGLFQGTGSGFDLERSPTRAEAVVMLVRLLGKEEEAEETVAKAKQHPFSDVPDWANPHVTYAYNHGLTNGMSATRFGSREEVTLTQYSTFLLRALGYDDSAGDFQWQEANKKLMDLDMTTKADYYGGEGVFLRGHVVDLSYHALSLTLKDEEITLLDKLVAEGAVLLEAVEEDERIVRMEDRVIVPISYAESEWSKGFYHIYVSPTILRQALPTAHTLMWGLSFASGDDSVDVQIEAALISSWGYIEYPEFLKTMEGDLGFYYEDGGRVETRIVYNEYDEPIAYTSTADISEDLTQMTFYTKIPVQVAEKIALAQSIVENAYYYSHDDFYVVDHEYAAGYDDERHEPIMETIKYVVINKERLPGFARHFTRKTFMRFPFEEDGSAKNIESLGEVKSILEGLQRSLFSMDLIGFRGITLETGEFLHSIGDYDEDWSLDFVVLLNDDDHILAYTYFTDEDNKAWVERVQNRERL